MHINWHDLVLGSPDKITAVRVRYPGSVGILPDVFPKPLTTLPQKPAFDLEIRGGSPGHKLLGSDQCSPIIRLQHSHNADIITKHQVTPDQIAHVDGKILIQAKVRRLGRLDHPPKFFVPKDPVLQPAFKIFQIGDLRLKRPQVEDKAPCFRPVYQGFGLGTLPFFRIIACIARWLKELRV